MNYQFLLPSSIGNTGALFSFLASFFPVLQVDLLSITHLEDHHILVLPGVGRFSSFLPYHTHIKQLLSSNSRSRIIGICAGFQYLVASESPESPNVPGLSLLTSDPCKSLRSEGQKMHIGPKLVRSHLLPDFFAYYLHNFYIPTSSFSSIEYGSTSYCRTDITAFVIHKNILGLQFHPEKSGQDGYKAFSFLLHHLLG